MTTYIIFPDTNDGFLTSHNTTFATAQAGSNFITDTTGTQLKVGMNTSGTGEYFLHQTFLSFDTSVIVDTEEIVDATITGYMGFPLAQKTQWGQQFLNYNWTAPLTSASWRTPTQAKALTQFANFDNLFLATPFQTRVTGKDSLVTGISKTAATKFVVVSNQYVDGLAPNGVQEIWMDSVSGSNKPYMTVYTTTLSALTNVSEASTTLPDGVSVSIRSNGAASPTLTVGYNTLTSSTWTSIGTLHADFTKNIDSANSLAVTSDTAGNFFIFGVKTGTTATIVGQAYQRLTTTTWSAKTPISQALPTGNEQTVRSLEAVYLVGGTDSSDVPAIGLIAARGSGGNRPNFQYHVSGAGFPHNSLVSPVALLAGSGSLFYTAGNEFESFKACGVPSFVDTVALSNTDSVVYAQRGKLGSSTVGGLAVLRKYGKKQTVLGKDVSYVATGAAQLVAISSNLFAHIFDEAGLKLTIRFYNSSAQILGTASIAKEAFFGGVIANQWAAHYDKQANLIRVYYIDVAATRTLSRADISPVTYNVTTTLAVTAALGAASSVNSDIRVSRTADERRVAIEAANNLTGTLSVQSYYSTAGNVAPAAPALTVHDNFDATSATTFSWTFGDANPQDTQTAYQLEISRVSDSVVVYDSAKVTSTAQTATVAANVLVNAVDYRWRVRTYDVVGATGTYSGYGTFTTAATGTLTIVDPSADNVVGIETSTYLVQWNYVQSGGLTQTNRRVRVIRTSDSVVIYDSTLQAVTGNTKLIDSLESGKEYRVEVSLRNSGGIDVPVVSRLITPYYSEPMTPSLDISQLESYNELVVTNPTPTGERPEVIYNDIYKRRTLAGSTAADFKLIATVTNSATYRDYALKSGASYDYFVTGRTS
jgi:hypothetical protein